MKLIASRLSHTLHTPGWKSRCTVNIDTLETDGKPLRKPALKVPVLLSNRSWWTLDGNRTAIYTTNNPWEVPIKMDLPFLVSLTSSMRETWWKHSSQMASQTLNYSAHGCLNNTGQIQSFSMKNSRSLPLWNREENLGSSKDIISSEFSSFSSFSPCSITNIAI